MTDVDNDREWRRFGPESFERRMLLALSAHEGRPFRPRGLTLPSGNRVEVEGIDAAGTTLVQVVGNLGAYRPAFRNKVLATMLKLLWLRSALPAASRSILLVTETILPAMSGWVSTAAADLDVEIYVCSSDGLIRLPEPERG